MSVWNHQKGLRLSWGVAVNGFGVGRPDLRGSWMHLYECGNLRTINIYSTTW
jgi:hypothetical protein